MQRVDRSIFVLFLLGFFTVASAQLPPEITADAYLLQVEQSIRGGDLNRARTVIQNIRNLQEQHELDLSSEFHFRYAKAADAVDLSDQALESIVKYLVASGREGQHYVEALALINKVKDRSSGDVVAAQLSPNIIADAYLLQAEQSIRDRDLDHARTVIQNIRNLQEQHELDLPDEFHFGYAKAADVLDMPDQALESILKYLAVSGREGQHYLEALALMNKMQMAVSCKGWDTEEYFKTATLEETTACLDAGVDLNERDDAGATPLHRAAQNTENQDVIKALIEAGADLDIQDKDKETPLHWATRYNNLVAIKTLIEAGADLEVKGNNERTPLGNAVSFCDRAAIEVLIKAGANWARAKDTWTSLHWLAAYNENPITIQALLNTGFNPQAMDDAKQTPLHIAAKFGNLVAIKVLLDAGADLKAKAKDNQRPLHLAAAYSEDPDIVKVLINAGADLKAKAKDNQRPLHYAARYNKNPDVVKVLINAGADPNARAKNDWTPLHLAAGFNKNPSVVEFLLKAGADLKAKDKDKWTLLHWAAGFNKNPSVVEFLLNAGSNPNARAKNDWTPLHVAAAYNENPDVVKVLIETGADLEARTSEKYTPWYQATPLHYAAGYNENPEILKVLIEAGADLEARTKDEHTPLHLAAWDNKNPEILKVLIEAGADLEARAGEKYTRLYQATPLHYAGYNENPEILKVLIEAGADLQAENPAKWTPLHIAAYCRNLGVIKALIDAGADPKAQTIKGETSLDLAEDGYGDNKSAVIKVLRDAGAKKKESGLGLGKTAVALIGGAAITYAGKDAADQEAVAEAARQFMEGVLNEQPPVGSGNSNPAGTSPQTQSGQAQDPMQQALQNLENVCGEKYQGNFSADDHARFYCLAAFNDYCALKRAKSDEAIGKLRASLQQNCAALKKDGLESKCPYCK